MNDEAKARRINDWYDKPFPDYDRNNFPSDQHRVAAAAEYAAHHLGRISKALDRIASALETKS